MRRREIILLAAVLVLLVVFPSPGHGGLNPWDWKYGLTQEQQIIVLDCIVEGQKQLKALSAAGRTKEAKELEGILKNLEGRTYSRTNNPFGYMKGAYAHVSSGIGLRTIHLYNSFFDISKDRRYNHTFGANAAFTVGQIDRNWVRSLQVFYLGGLFLMPAFHTGELVDLFRFCRQHGVVTVADVVIPQNAAVPENLGELLDVVDYFLPNDDEARTLTGLAQPIEQLRAFIQGGANTVIITRGKQGVMAGRGGEYWQAGVYEMNEVVDPSGCGDAFAAGVVTGIVHGWDIQQTMRFASATGASAVRALGTTGGVFTFAQAQEFIAGNHLEIIQGKL